MKVRSFIFPGQESESPIVNAEALNDGSGFIRQGTILFVFKLLIKSDYSVYYLFHNLIC